MRTLETLGAFIARDGHEILTEEVYRTIRLHLVDTVGAWIAGRHTEEGRLVARFAAPEGPYARHEAEGDRMLDRVMLNCALVRLSEMDDIHLSSCTTPGALIIPAAMTMAAAMGIKERRHVAGAILAGYEAMVRLGSALQGPQILYRGIWPTYLTAPFGVAAAASRLLRMREREAAHALGISLILSSPGVGHQSGPAMSRWIAIGQAARNGVLATLAANGGFAGDLGILEGDFFKSVYGIEPEVAALTERIGEASVLSEVSFKPWCAAKQTMAATQAFREILASGLSPGEIDSVAVFVPQHYLKMISHGIAAGNRMSHISSVSYQMALAAFEPETLYDARRTPSAVSDEIRAFMARVSVEADEELLQHYPRAWPARVLVRTQSAKHEKLLTHVPGDAQRPFDEREVVQKFRRVVAPLIGGEATDRLLHRALVAIAEDGAVAPLLNEIEKTLHGGTR